MPENKVLFDKIYIFPTYIWNTFIQNLDLNFWVKEVYEYQQKFPEGVHKSNTGGYQSPPNIHHYQPFFPLVDLLNTYVFNFSSNPNFKIFDMWVNISPPTSFNLIHNHGDDKTLSGVLYLKSFPNSGNICFYNNLNPNEFHCIKPENGKLLLFESPLFHSVNPNLSQEDRISIAFNIK